MILMLIEFYDNGLLAFWGATPQDCWTQFIVQRADELEDFEDDDLDNLAYAAEFYDDPPALGVSCNIERKILFT